ncbi:MAG: hypothetical protein V2J07_05640 [Anaerolineae bacterium]|jgi:hypothetical protein|nr:hypothetical protein [Anaerolineae bacterium]
MRPIFLILIGGALVIAGALLPFLMVLQELETTFFWAFFSYGASIIGLFLGMWGAFSYMRVERTKLKAKKDYDREMEQYRDQ